MTGAAAGRGRLPLVVLAVFTLCLLGLSRELGLPADPFNFFLEHARVALTAGREFGAPGKGFVRLNFATSRTILMEILERMRAAVEKQSAEP